MNPEPKFAREFKFFDIASFVRAAVLEMEARVIYDDESHTYKDRVTGEWYQGVSKVSSIVPKDWLSAWGAKEAVKALGYSDYEGDTALASEILEKARACKTPEEWIAILKDAKGASGRKSKTALIDGKEGHAWLESFVKARIAGLAAPELPEGPLERPVKQFLAWEKDAVDYWILSEARVCNPEKKYAGTLDALAMMKSGRLALIDFKFASHISEDYHLQTAGYAACFEQYGIDIPDRVILRLPKTDTREEWNPVTHKYSMVPNDLEVFTVDTDYFTDRETFYHALPLKAWINRMEARKKDLESQKFTPPKRSTSAKTNTSKPINT